MTTNDADYQKATKLVDFIIASDRLEGLETPPEDRAVLIDLALGKIPAEDYIAGLKGDFRARAEKTRALSGRGYSPSHPSQEPHPRFSSPEAP